LSAILRIGPVNRGFDAKFLRIWASPPVTVRQTDPQHAQHGPENAGRVGTQPPRALEAWGVFAGDKGPTARESPAVARAGGAALVSEWNGTQCPAAMTDRDRSSPADPQDNYGGVAEDAPPLTNLGKPNKAQTQKRHACVQARHGADRAVRRKRKWRSHAVTAMM
jgi:hypothetical protein